MRLQPRLHSAVIKIGGGSLIDDRRVLNQHHINEVVATIEVVKSFVDHLYIVVGGAGAHFYIELARGYGATEAESDDIGIIATHLASLVLLSALRRRIYDLYSGVAMSLAEIDEASRSYGAVVVGPLQKAATSSDSVAALTAEHVNAEALAIVKAWHLGDRVPVDCSQGGTLDRARLEDVMEAIRTQKELAGRRPILDMACLRILQRVRYRTFVVAFDQLGSLSKLAEPERVAAVELVSDLQRERSGALGKLRPIVPVLVERARTLLEGLDDVIHDFGHVDRCASTAMLLGSVYPYAQPSIIEVGAWWHDVGRLYGASDHEARSAEMLTQELVRAGVDESVVMDSAQAVAFHKWSMRPSSLEGKIVRDADKLDAVAPERWQLWDVAASNGSIIPESELDLVSRVACDLDRLLSLKAALVVLRARRSELRGVVSSLNNGKVSRFAALAAD